MIARPLKLLLPLLCCLAALCVLLAGCGAGQLVKDIAVEADRVAAADAANQEKLIQRIEELQSIRAKATLQLAFADMRGKKEATDADWASFFEEIITYMENRLAEKDASVDYRRHVAENLATRRHLWDQAIRAANAAGERDVIEARLDRLERILIPIAESLARNE